MGRVLLVRRVRRVAGSARRVEHQAGAVVLGIRGMRRRGDGVLGRLRRGIGRRVMWRARKHRHGGERRLGRCGGRYAVKAKAEEGGSR